MFKRVCFAGLVVLFAHSVYANTIRDMSADNMDSVLSGMGTLDFGQDVGTGVDVETIDEAFLSDFAVLEEKMKRVAPHVVRENLSKSEFERMFVYRQYIMYETYNLFKEKIKEHFLGLSKQTGRSIKKYGPNNSIVAADGISGDGIYWLDRGELDRPECQILYDGVVSGYFKCSYPDDYSEAQVMFSKEEVFFEVDIERNEKKQHVEVGVTGANMLSSDIYFDYFVVTSDYDDYYRYMIEDNKQALEYASIMENVVKGKKLRKACESGRLECERKKTDLPEFFIEGKSYSLGGKI